METPDIQMHEYSTLQCNNINANLLSQFEDQDKTKVEADRVPGGAADLLTVYLRIRPFSGREVSDKNNTSCIKILNKNDLITLPPLSSHTHKGLKKGVSDMQTLFSFTRIFDDQTGQKEFYDSAVLDYIQDFLRGHNVLIFAYGVTNSGKTYTMAGTRSNPGVLPRALDSIFQAIEHQQPTKILYKPKGFANAIRLDKESSEYEITKTRKYMRKKLNKHNLLSDLSKISEGSDSQASTIVSNQQSDQEITDTLKSSRINIDPLDLSSIEMELDETSYSIWVSFVEIHNESIYDLLDGAHKLGHARKVPLKLADDQDGNVFIKDIIEIGCNTAMEALHLFLLGEQQRKVGETKLNLNSSRSHIIFSLRCIRIDENGSPSRINTLSLVDLAGSERQVGTKAEGERLKEAGNINMSLLTLGRCIEMMRHNQSKNTTALRIVPFRESKLTRIFQSYLVGRSEIGYEGKLTMIVNISQTADTFDETCHALKFSAVAREVIPLTIEVPRPVIRSDKGSDLTERTTILEETINEFSITTMDIEQLDEVQMREYCGELEKHRDSLIEMVVNLKVEALEIEKRIRKELSVQFSLELHAIKSREASKQMKAIENINTYHETRMNILQHSIKKDRRLRMRRSRSVDTIVTMDSNSINTIDTGETMDTMDTINVGANSEKLHDALNSAESTIDKLNKDITALRLEYGDNLKQLASLQKEKAQISAQLESTQDRLQDAQRDMREMCSEYDHKLLDSQQSAENKFESKREIARLGAELTMTLAQKEELYTLVKELESQLSDIQQQLLIKKSSKEEETQQIGTPDLHKLESTSNMATKFQRIEELEQENKLMKQKIEDHSSEINEKCKEFLRTQTTLKSLEEEHEFTKTSLQSEINILGEETRSLNKRLTSAEKQNDSLLKKYNKLSELKNEIAKNDANLQNKNHVLALKDGTISELESQLNEHKLTVSNLREQASSTEERLTLMQAEQAARDGEAAYYKSKISQLEDRNRLFQQSEELCSQLKSELMHAKKQLFEDRISYEKRIGQLEVELKQRSFVPTSSVIQKTDDSGVYKPTRSSSHTYISMKDNDSPHYESIHSSMIQDISHATTLAPETKAVIDREDSFDSYASTHRSTAVSSEPIYQNLPCGRDSLSSELAEPSFSAENRYTHTVNIKPLLKGKRKSTHGDTPSPPAKKRTRTNRLLKRTVKKGTVERNSKKLIKEENCTQVILSPILESETPKRGFQFSFKKAKNSTPEKLSTPTSLSLFSREKSKFKSKKKLIKKSEISAPLEITHSPSPADYPLRRLRPRK